MKKKSYTAPNHSKRSRTTVTRTFTITIRIECKHYFITKSDIARYLIDSFIFFAMLAIPLTGISIYFEKYFIMWALIPLAILIFTLGYATFKTNGYSVNGEQITLVYRSLGKYTGLVRRRHVQSMEKDTIIFPA